MKVLSLSLDPHILRADSVVATRSCRYGEVLERFTIIVPVPQAATQTLAPRVIVFGTGGRTKVGQLWRLYRHARQLMAAEHYDVISSQDTYFLGLVAVWLARRYHCGVEVQVHGIEKLSWWRALLARYVLRRAGSIRVASAVLQRHLCAQLTLTPERMRVVPIYVDVTALGFDSATQPPAVQAVLQEKRRAFTAAYGDRCNVVSVNRLVSIKNIPMQLAAIATLKAQYPQLLLHIVGDGPLRAALQAEIVQRGLTEHVMLHGYQAGIDLSTFFTASDCFVLTSDFEGYGMVVIEAAKAGLPIVMTEVGCAGEVVHDGTSALIVPPRDTAAFTAALERVLTDAALRARLAAGAAQASEQLPSFATVLAEYQASWQQALAHRR